METTLRGHNGSETLFVNNTGKVIEISERTEPTAGNDVYLSIDAEYQKAAYDILEQKIARNPLFQDRKYPGICCFGEVDSL